jgi:uncharacterized ferritin-like protein (DUF455 family)
MSTLRHLALELLRIADPHEKARRTRALDLSLPAGADDDIAEPPDLPGRPDKPVLVHHIDVPKPSMRTLEGRAALLHSLAHIECNAIKTVFLVGISPGEMNLPCR